MKADRELVPNRAFGRKARRGLQAVAGEPRPVNSDPDSSARLDSWEQIAAYLRRSVRSARRWEKEEGLPVHRDGDPVYAYREELDDWWMKDARMEPGASSRLDSWKEIAMYLRSSVRSVRRWEKDEGLPVRRHVHYRGDSVFAFRAELDAWRHGRGSKSGG